MSEAERAVRSAQSEASHANMRAEATHALANQVVEHLRRQLEQVMSENQELRARCFQQRPDPLNGAGMFTARMIAMEERMRVLEDQLNQHHTFIQELWMRPQQSIVSQVHTPANRAQPSSPTHFNIGENENDSGDDEDANNNAEDVESKALRTKDLHHLKLPPLPDSAAGYRTWRNSVRTALLAFDRSIEGILGSWLSKAFTARGHEAVELSRDSGSFPRCDRVIASVLCRQETLKSNFGLRIQAYVEKCEIADENVRGRYILNIIASEFDTANVATSITTSLELFQLPAPQDGVHGLRHWHDKVTYILSQLSVQQRPAEDMPAHWAYNSLKKHAFMRRVIDRYQEFPTFRTFDYLWEGVETALRESQHDSNAQSIREDLRKGPSNSKKESKAMVAKGSQPKEKGKKDQGPAPKGSPKGKGNKEPSDKKKDAGPGSPNPKSKPSTSSNPPPCVFFQRGKVH